MNFTNELDARILSIAKSNIEIYISRAEYELHDAEREIERSKDWECKDTFKFYSEKKSEAIKAISDYRKVLARIEELSN